LRRDGPIKTHRRWQREKETRCDAFSFGYFFLSYLFFLVGLFKKMKKKITKICYLHWNYPSILFLFFTRRTSWLSFFFFKWVVQRGRYFQFFRLFFCCITFGR
jgi:hypothetical protein